MQVESICRQVIGQAAWPKLPALPALAIAVFGRAYTEDAKRFLRSARSWQQLVQKGDCQVIVFTDQSEAFLSLAWVTVLPVRAIADWPAGDRFTSRFCKWALPFLLPDVPSSVCVDTLNVVPINCCRNILQLFADVSDAEFLVTEHIRESWHDEYKAIKRWPNKVSDHDRLDRQEKWYEQQGLPDTVPVFKNSLLGRVHASDSAQCLSRAVLEQLHDFSERDQLALSYAVFTTTVLPVCRPNGFYYATVHGSKPIDPTRIIAVHRNVQRSRLPLWVNLEFRWHCWWRGAYRQL